MADYRKLKVWEESFILAGDSFELAKKARREGGRDMEDQMKRSALSIPTNIAEGSGRRSRKDFARFLEYSLASSCELESQLSLARKINAVPYAETEVALQKIEAVRKMLTSLIDKLQA